MPRTLLPDQRCIVHIAEVTDDGLVVSDVLETAELLLEAPNWTLDGAALVLNGDGALWRLPLDDGALERIDLDVPELNNDHVLDPDGEHVFVSAMDGHIYRGALAGGPTVCMTDARHGDGFWHFLHGVSPEGDEIAYVGLVIGGGTLGAGEAYAQRVSAAGPVGSTRQLTSSGKHVDGPEYSGEWVYLNTEQFSEAPGHAQVARLPREGGELEQLTFDDCVNWFPHLAPDGSRAVYIAFPTGTLGHPENLPVTLNLVEDDAWAAPVASQDLFGGQGTINVNSWAPDSRRFAFCSYPLS